MIKYISFMPDIAVTVGTRDITSMQGYSHDKHGKDLDVERYPGGFYFWIKKDNKRTQERIELPLHAVASVRETIDAPTGGKKP